MRGLCSVLMCVMLILSISPLYVPVGEEIMSQATGTEFLTFWSGDLIIMAQEPDTKVHLYDLDTGGLLSTTDPRLSSPPITNPFILSNFGDSWEEKGGVGNLNQEIRLKVVTSDAAGGTATKPVTIWTGYLNPGSANPWMSYVPAYGETGRSGTELGYEFLGFADEEMYIFALKDPSATTNITVDDMVTNLDADTDDDYTLTPASPELDYSDSEIEIFYITGFEEDTVHVTSNVLASVLVGKRSRNVNLNDWSATPPSYAAGDEGVEIGTLFYAYVRSYLTVFPLEDDTHVTIVDLSDGDDSFNVTLDGDDSDGTYQFYTATEDSFSHGLILPRGSNPSVSIVSPDNAFDYDYVKIASDKPVLIYDGPVGSNVLDYADVAYSIPTGPSSQELYCYAQNSGNSNDLQIFAYNQSTNVTIKSLTRTQFFRSPSHHDFTIGPAGTAWTKGTDGFGFWWGSDVWSGEILHITSDQPITVINGDYDEPQTFGAFLPYTHIGPQPPVADAGEDQTVEEGEDVTLNGSGSFDPDDLDVLTAYEWDLDDRIDSNGDGVYTNDADATGVIVTHTYGDNGIFNVTLTVTDSQGLQDNDTVQITVENVLPEVQMDTSFSGDEGSDILFEISVSDPGSDDITVLWSWGDGTSNTETHYNDGLGPDPYPSPEINPVTLNLAETHSYGHAGTYDVIVTVTDDDGGETPANAQAVIANMPPTVAISFAAPNPANEGDFVTFDGYFNDPSWLDNHTAEWDFGDSPPTQGSFSPGWGSSHHEMDAAQHAYGDNDVYSVILTVEDDFGASDSDQVEITVLNVAPTVSGTVSGTGYEPATLSFDGSFADPGWLDTWEWWWDFRPDHDSDGDGNPTNDRDVEGQVLAAGQLPTVQWTFNDDYEGPVYLYVLDDDDGLGMTIVDVTVENVAPEMTAQPRYFFNASMGLRIAGEKWHDVTIYLFEDDIEIWTATLMRHPGSPNEQMAWFENVSINLSRAYRAEVYYTPADDPVNGQIWGATPAWLIAEFEDSSESRLHHTFNVRHEKTWFWDVRNVSDLFLGHNITFLADGTDPGSDDLVFEWNWGDSTVSTVTYYNDGSAPDAHPSYWYGTYLFSAHCLVMHAFGGHGTYVVTVQLYDDDGGAVTTTFLITI